MNWSRLVGNLLLVAGIASLAVATMAYATDLFGHERVLPRPVALEIGGAGISAGGAAVPTAEAATPAPAAAGDAAAVQEAATPTPLATVVATRAPTETPTPTPAKPGIPVRMVIPSIGVDSVVQEVGTYWEKGQLAWETVPFVVGHYRTTAKAGESGNAVFSGHVSSRNAGNVFRDLYKVQLGDQLEIHTADASFIYEVTDVRLVLPTETSVMNPTLDARATLITCAGEWIPTERAFSHRLIVTAKLKR